MCGKCSNGSYCPDTLMLKNRQVEPNTKVRRAVHLVYPEMYETKYKALKREYEIKTYTRQKEIAIN